MQKKDKSYKKKEIMRKELRDARQQYMQEKGKCDCLQENHTSIQKTLKAYTDKYHKLDEEKKEADGEIERLTTEKSEAESKLLSLQKAEQQLRTMYDELNDAHQYLINGKSTPDQATQTQIGSLKERVRSLEKELTDLNK